MNEQRQSGELKPIRTYERDVEEVLHGQNVSLSKIALAESVKRRRPSAPSPLAQPLRIVLPQGARTGIGQHRWFSSSFALFGIIAALAAGALSIAWLFFGAGGETAPAPFEPRVREEKGAPLVFTEEQRTAFIARVRGAVAQMQVPLSELSLLPLRKKDGGDAVALSFEELSAALEAGTPPALARALLPPLTAGIHGIRGNQLFFLFPVTSFDNAFESMLLWERTMIRDIGPLFGINERSVADAAATTTKEALANRLTFRDVVVKNKDLRAVFDKAGKIIFLYSFPDKQSLIITTNEETFRALLPRVSRGALR